MKSNYLRINSIVPISEANGPGPHFTIWVQGCTLKCAKCFNPQSHNVNEGNLISIDNILLLVPLQLSQ